MQSTRHSDHPGEAPRSDSGKPASALQREFNVWLGFFGIVSGGLSLVSLMQKAFEVGLHPVLADFLRFYRAFFHPIIGSLLAWVPWEIPGWYKDLATLSFVLLVLQQRSVMWGMGPSVARQLSSIWMKHTVRRRSIRARSPESHYALWHPIAIVRLIFAREFWFLLCSALAILLLTAAHLAGVVLLFVILGVMLWGLIVPLQMLYIRVSQPDRPEFQTYATIKLFFYSCAGMFGCAIAFFAFNAGVF